MKKLNILENARLVTLGIDEIDSSDRTFAVSWPAERGVEELAREIESSGFADPLWVTESVAGERKYRLVCGFRRLAAARQAGLSGLEALVIGGEISGKELFRARLAVGGRGKRLSAVEAARVIERLETKISPGENELARDFLPLMGLGVGRLQLERCRLVDELEEPVARYCAESDVALREVSLWAAFPPQGQRALLELVQAVRPGANLLRSFLELLGEVCIRDGNTVERVLADSFIRHVVEDQQKARSGGRERVHKRLRELRYPVTTQIEERFDRARCLLGFPGGGAVKLTPPPFFEGEKIRVSFEAGSAEELGVFAEKLLDASSLDAAHELFRCLGAPDDEIESPGEGREP